MSRYCAIARISKGDKRQNDVDSDSLKRDIMDDHECWVTAQPWIYCTIKKRIISVFALLTSISVSWKNRKSKKEKKRSYRRNALWSQPLQRRCAKQQLTIRSHNVRIFDCLCNKLYTSIMLQRSGKALNPNVIVQGRKFVPDTKVFSICLCINLESILTRVH